MAKKRRKIPGRPGVRGKKKAPGANQDMMRQVAQLQEQMQKAQEELEATEFEASSGGGAVTAKVNGSQRLVSLSIDPDVIDEDDIEMLEDMIIAAVNEAQNSASEAQAEQSSAFTGGLGIDLPDVF